MSEVFVCPECESSSIKYRFKVDYKNKIYAGVTEEIQCAQCFMDIPSNLFAVVIYSPQSQRLVVCSMVNK